MHPAQRRELFILEGLNSQRQAVDAGSAKPGKLLRLRAARVGFQGGFEGVCQRYPLPDTLHQPTNAGSAEQAWCTAADEQRLDHAALHEGQVGLQVCQQAIDIGGFRQVAGFV